MAKKHIQSYTAHDIHFDGYTDTDGVYYAFKATIPAGYKAPKNVVSIEEEDLEKLQKSHVFKALVEAKKVAFIDQLPRVVRRPHRTDRRRTDQDRRSGQRCLGRQAGSRRRQIRTRTPEEGRRRTRDRSLNDASSVCILESQFPRSH